MPRRCAVIGCDLNGSTQNKSFYRFPSDQELCKKWLKALCNLELVKIYEKEGFNYLNKNKFVCSDHFETKHLRNVKAPSQGLFEGAIPAINLNLNIDALITSLKQSEMLNELTPPMPICRNHINNVPFKCAKDKTSQILENSKQLQEGSCNKTSKLIKPIDIGKDKISTDDIPLKQLYGGKIKLLKTHASDQDSHKKNNMSDVEFKTKRKKIKSKEKCPLKKHKDKKKNKHSKRLNKIEEIYLPSSQTSDRETAKVKKDSHVKRLKVKHKYSLASLKKKLTLGKLSDPLENMKAEPEDELTRHRSRKIKKMKKGSRHKNKGIKKKKALPKNKKKFIIIKNKNVDDEEIRLSTQGPKKIIKVNQGQNKFIKVVVPKRSINGKEINLEKSEINKILKLVSAPKNLNEKQLKIITQTSEVNNVLKSVSASKNVVSEEKQVNTQKTNDCESQNNVSVPKNIRNVVQLNTQCPEKLKTLKPVPPPKNIDGKEIKLITLSPGNGKILTKVCASKNIVDNREIKLIANSSENSSVFKGDPIPTINAVNQNLDNIEDVNDSSVFENSNTNDSELVPLDTQSTDNTEISKPTTPPRNTHNEELNPMTKELRKRIKLMIGQRFGEFHDSSDSESQEADRDGNKSKKKKKKCACNSEFHEKMMSLWQEERELKRRIVNIQNLATKHKMDNRKLAATVLELRQQIPEKKPPKPGHIIKTIVPINKVKEKNPRKYRFTKILKTFALDLFYSSPLSYSILEKIYFLPSRKTLKNWLVHPKNMSNDLLPPSEMNYETTHESAQSVEEYIDVGENNEYVARQPEAIQHDTDMGHHHDMETHNMGTIEDNIEPLQENIDDIMFRNDLAEAIMNS